MKITKEFLQSGFVSVDIFAVSPIDETTERTPMVRRANPEAQLMTSFAVGEESEQQGPIVIRDVGQVAAPIDKAQPIVAPGSTIRVDVVVGTRKSGHFFPGGAWTPSACGSSCGARRRWTRDLLGPGRTGAGR